MSRFRLSTLCLLLVTASLAMPARVRAQSDVSPSDIQRLQDYVYDASREISQLRTRDTGFASQLQTELDDARDETVYLRVKLRKNERITRADYATLRDRIDDIRMRAISGAAPRQAVPPPAVVAPPPVAPAPLPPRERPSLPPQRSGTTAFDEVAVGTEFDVRLQNPLNSATARVEDRFEATTVVDLLQDGRVIVPAGSVMRGLVSSVTKAGRIERRGALTAVFDRLTVNGRTYPIRATVTQAIESEGVRGEAGRIGAGAGVGAILGAILGGAKGALAGILIGGGGTMAATEGKDVELPPGTILRVRIDSGVSLR